MGDIHGNMRRFDSVLKQIKLQPEDTLYVLGDVIDRHPDGVRILRRLMAMPNVRVLLGNHEYMMLRALNEPYDQGEAPNLEECRFLWYRNGGEVTHRYWKRIRKTLRAEVIAYLKALPLNENIRVNGKDYRLVHAAPMEYFEAYTGPQHPNPTHFAVWKRWEDADPVPAGQTLIFGHTPTKYFRYANPMEVYFGENRIGVDCGSGFEDPGTDPYTARGRLACLRLDDMQVFYSEEIE